MISLEKFLLHVLENLPLIAAEGTDYTEADESDFLKEPWDNPANAAYLCMVRVILSRAGALDVNRLSEGRWKFVSYPARLFACSLISLFAGEDSIFPLGFWASDTNTDVSGQYNILHALETQRAGLVQQSPIRRTFVAWGVVKRNGHFILKRRENRSDDPDNVRHGNYVFPGGRLNMNDLAEAGADIDKLALLYGLPRPLDGKEKLAIGHALGKTLVRELQEELGLKHDSHYTFPKPPFQLNPKIFVHGANGQHCLTECNISFYEVLLTPDGDAFLASRLQDGDIFSVDELLSSNPGERRLFLDLSDNNVVSYLKKSADSASSFELRQSELIPQGAKGKKADDPSVCIIPISLNEPLKLGDLEINIEDQRYVDLLLLLGLNARFGEKVRLESNNIERKRWGWLKLDQDFLNTARELDKFINKNYGFSFLILRDGLCRLRVADENIFFCGDMFSAEIKDNDFVITRCRQYCNGVFFLDEESRAARLTSPNMEHLRNLQNGEYDLVSYDNLRKLVTTGNQPLDDFARQFGIYRLYEPIDPDRSRETRVFRFGVRVR